MTTAPAGPAASLHQRAARGLAWNTGSGIAIRVMRTAVFVALARLLAPRDFGLVALAAVFQALLSPFISQGFGQAIIQRPVLERRHLDTTFWFSIVTGCLLAGAQVGLAPALARALHEPGLTAILRAMAVVYVLAGLASVPEAVLNRELAFGPLAVRGTVAALLSCAVGLGLALAGAGAWALVAQVVGEALVDCIGLWLITSYRPGRSVDRRTLGELASFGVKVLGGNVMVFLSTKSDDLLVGAVLGARALGVYSVGYRLLTQLQDILLTSTRAVALPVFSRLQSDRERLRRTYSRVAGLVYAVTLPVFLLAGVLAGPVVHLLFSSTWDDAVPVMAALSAVGVVTGITSLNSSLNVATGGAGRAFWFTTANTVVNVIGFAVAVHFGIVAVAIAFTVRAYLLAPWSFRLLRSAIDMSWADVRRRFLPLLVAVAPAVLVAAALVQLLQRRLSPLPLCLVAAAAAVPPYLVMLHWLTPDVLADAARFCDSIGIHRRLPRRLGSRRTA